MKIRNLFRGGDPDATAARYRGTTWMDFRNRLSEAARGFDEPLRQARQESAEHPAFLLYRLAIECSWLMTRDQQVLGGHLQALSWAAFIVLAVKPRRE